MSSSVLHWHTELSLHSFPTRRSSDLIRLMTEEIAPLTAAEGDFFAATKNAEAGAQLIERLRARLGENAVRTLALHADHRDRKSTRLNSSHRCNSYAVFCLKKKTTPYHKSSFLISLLLFSIPPLIAGYCPSSLTR